MQIKLTGRKIKEEDFGWRTEITIDINDLYKQLKKCGFEILDFYDSRRTTYSEDENQDIGDLHPIGEGFKP